MNDTCRQQLLNAGGRCPFPDTDPDVWIAPDGTVGRIIIVDLDPRLGEGDWRIDWQPLRMH